MSSGWTRVSLLWTLPAFSKVVGEPTFTVPRSQLGKVVSLPEKWSDPDKVTELLEQYKLQFPMAEVFAVVHDDEHTTVFSVYVLMLCEIAKIDPREFQAFTGFSPQDYMGFTKLHDERG